MIRACAVALLVIVIAALVHACRIFTDESPTGGLGWVDGLERDRPRRGGRR